jgi:hypothetical protein
MKFEDWLLALDGEAGGGSPGKSAQALESMDVLLNLAAPDIVRLAVAARRVEQWGPGEKAPARCQTDFLDLRAALKALDEHAEQRP